MCAEMTSTLITHLLTVLKNESVVAREYLQTNIWEYTLPRSQLYLLSYFVFEDLYSDLLSVWL
jgi:hypothetical protein